MDAVKIGRIIDATHKRDAIHIAIAPVEAAERLLPGARVGVLFDGRAASAERVKPTGIVDPFLDTAAVEPGQWFYMFLFPNTVTGLRHAWTHPSFTDEPAGR
jgi:hypothetical protein